MDITLTNKGVNTLSALQGRLTLPEGLEIVVPDAEEPEELFIYSDRIPLQSQFKFQENNGILSFVLSSSMNAKIIENDGVIFSFIVKASADLDENTEISLTDLRVATTTGKSQLCDPLTIKVTNTSVADKAAFEAYQAEQAAAVEALAEEGDSEASQQIIADAVAAIEALTFDYDKTLDENKAAVDEIVEPVAEALAAQREADAIIPGDVNGDGEVDTRDAICVLKYVVGNTPEVFNADAADFNEDGEIDTRDAIAILKKVVE